MSTSVPSCEYLLSGAPLAMSGANQSDADIVLKLYDLRRETVMRESRRQLTGEFWPKSYDEAAAVMDPKHPLNAAFRQVTSYWEMALSFARHGAVNRELLIENSGEAFFVYSKFEPFIDELRVKNSPTMFNNVRWAIESSPWAQERLKLFQARVAKMTGR